MCLLLVLYVCSVPPRRQLFIRITAVIPGHRLFGKRVRTIKPSRLDHVPLCRPRPLTNPPTFLEPPIDIDMVLLQLLQQGLLLATEGLKNLSSWSAHLRELHSWKLSQTQPTPLRRVNVRPATSGRVPQSPRQAQTGALGGQWGAPPPYFPAAPELDQSLRQQFAHQDSMQTDESTPNHMTTSLQQHAMLAQGVSSQLELYPVLPQGYQQGPTHMTASPQMVPGQSSASLATSEAASADCGGTLQQRLPSQRQAQPSTLFAAVAAATQLNLMASSESGALTVATSWFVELPGQFKTACQRMITCMCDFVHIHKHEQLKAMPESGVLLACFWYAVNTSLS